MLALLTRAVFRDLGSKVPSITRWYTFAPSLERQGLGLMLHNVLARVRGLAGGVENVNANEPLEAHGW
eukprot:15460409-Heterocapsa_arctica.AAC.1